MAKFRDIKVTYQPREIIKYLKTKGKNSFTVLDLKDKFGNDQSIAAWVLHDLTVLGVLKPNHEVEYVNNIPYRSFRLMKENPENLPEEREATFRRLVNST